MKTVLNISLLGCLFASVTSYAAQKPYTLAYTANPPFTMTENGKPQGYAVKIIAAVFAQAKIPYQFVEVPLARAMENARTTKSYCVFPVQRAQNIEAEYQWVSPILVTRSGLFARSDFNEQLITLDDAKKMTIGALRGSGDAEYLRGFGYTVEEATTQDQNIDKLLAKRFPLWATDAFSANFFMQKKGATKDVLTFRSTLSSLACNTAMSKADMSALQNTLDTMIKQGTLKKIAATAN